MEKKNDFLWLEQEKEEMTSFEIKNQALIIHFREDLDHHNALFVREQADKILEQQNVKNIVFDFEGVKFMDSSGIGVIMGRYKKVIFIGGKIAATGIGDAVDRILKLSGLYKIMDRYKTADEAVERLVLSSVNGCRK